MDIEQLTKKCSKCGEVKPLNEFYENRRTKGGRESSCKKCKAEYQYENKERIANYQKENKEYKKKYRQDNQERIKNYNKEYKQKHKKEIAIQFKKYREENKERESEQHKKYKRQHKDEISKLSKQWYIKNREKLLEQNKKYNKLHRNEINSRVEERKKTDLKYSLNCRTSCSIRYSLKGNKRGYHWENLVGYNCNDLIKRLKKTMPEGYTWQDYLEGKLEVDHIIPKSIFNFIKPEHIDFKRCWALSNLRLLPKKENRIKYNKLIKPFQLNLAI